MTSTIKVNNIQNQCGANIINESSNTITLGASGDTIALASGASQTGFGRTGTVDWITTPKTTGTFTAVSGEGYFLNTSGGVITANLPAGVAGAIVSFADYAATWQTNAVTVVPNGTDKIGSLNENAGLSTEGQSVTFVFVDSTQGWINTMDSTSNVRGSPPFIVATGGTILTCGNFKTHVFTGPGTFAVSCAGSACGSNTIDYLVVAGGGGSGGTGPDTAGAGAGGFRASNSYILPSPETSPVVAPAGLTASVGSFPITVGAGGAYKPAPTGPGGSGANSIFSTITSAGGGGGGNYGGYLGVVGGSGGGSSTNCGVGAAGNTPPVSPAQGFGGGNGTGPLSPASGPVHRASGGGGGAGAAGANATPGGAGDGGVGAYVSNTFFGPTAPSYGETGPVTPTRYFAGGGGGSAVGAARPIGGDGGAGGGGNGTQSPPAPQVNGTAGTINTGGGSGGGGNGAGSTFTGGSGIVVIRYKFQ